MKRKPCKAEKELLAKIQAHNDARTLAGGPCPDSPDFLATKYRFLKKLFDNGEIEWHSWTRKYGAGWALKGFKTNDSSNSNSIYRRILRNVANYRFPKK